MTKRRKQHTPEEIVKKLRDAAAMLNASQDEAAVLQPLGITNPSSRLLIATERGCIFTFSSHDDPRRAIFQGTD